MPEELRASAPAKINLMLEVTGRRPDGYHEIDTVLQTLALADEVRLSRSSTPGLCVTGPFSAGVPADDSNLAWRAARELGQRLGEDASSLTITLDKQIPAAGGLGGGASDAATVLRLLQRWWPAADEQALMAAAAATGSDESFFLTGGTARARGRGERVTPLMPLAPHAVVLFVPRETVERKTARMFAALDALPFDRGGIAAAFAARAQERVGSADVYNAFERVAFDLFPGLAALWEELERRLQEPVRLAGAGPTLFWIGPPGRGEAVAACAAGLPCRAISTATAPSQWRP